MHEIGTMQGRLLPMVDGRIQAFPRDGWEREFPLAAEIGYDTIELTIEMASYDIHPVRSPAGRGQLLQIAEESGVGLAGLCCDVFMERPMTSAEEAVYEQSQEMLTTLIRDCAQLGLPMVEIPVMGDNSLRDVNGRERACKMLENVLPVAEDAGIDLILEADLPPQELLAFMDGFSHPRLGINYDSGNSMWLGYDPDDELPVYMQYVRNIHIKDCTVADYSLPLGQGDTEFDKVFGHLAALSYTGGFVVQAARQDDDLKAGRDYYAFTKNLVEHWLVAPDQG